MMMIVAAVLLVAVGAVLGGVVVFLGFIEEEEPRACEVCGDSEDEVRAAGHYWVTPGLCSRCAPFPHEHQFSERSF
ncbi:MAG: hypothetical protein IH614_13715 [Desulfuromonadales bacterium]|nr:hypothetical protein [Desulfuromonadales bacterium]